MIKDIIQSIYPISPAAQKVIEDLAEYTDVPKGEVFVKLNRPDSNEYFVINGVCRSYLVSPEGEEVTISFFKPQSILSPHTTRVREGRSVHFFQATTDAILASINASLFEQLMIDNLEIRNFANTVLRNELAQKVDKEIGLASLTAKERLIKFREQYPMLENLIPHSYIASYLGITNISLSRLRKELTP